MYTSTLRHEQAHTQGGVPTQRGPGLATSRASSRGVKKLGRKEGRASLSREAVALWLKLIRSVGFPVPESGTALSDH